jgi:hypothetical protein
MQKLREKSKRTGNITTIRNGKTDDSSPTSSHGSRRISTNHLKLNALALSMQWQLSAPNFPKRLHVEQ